jgi:hypothetical protein
MGWSDDGEIEDSLHSGANDLTADELNGYRTALRRRYMLLRSLEQLEAWRRIDIVS